jgi:hypothetical protein
LVLCSEPHLAFNRIVVLRYRSHLESRHLAPGTVNLRLGAVRRLAYEAADCGLLSADLAAGIRRVKGVKKLGVRLGNWLTAEQGQALWQAAQRKTRPRVLRPSARFVCHFRRSVSDSSTERQKKERTGDFPALSFSDQIGCHLGPYNIRDGAFRSVIAVP